MLVLIIYIYSNPFAQNSFIYSRFWQESLNDEGRQLVGGLGSSPRKFLRRCKSPGGNFRTRHRREGFGWIPLEEEAGGGSILRAEDHSAYHGRRRQPDADRLNRGIVPVWKREHASARKGHNIRAGLWGENRWLVTTEGKYLLQIRIL